MEAGWELGNRSGTGLETSRATMGCSSHGMHIYFRSSHHPLAVGYLHFHAIAGLRSRPELPRNGASRKGFLNSGQPVSDNNSVARAGREQRLAAEYGYPRPGLLTSLLPGGQCLALQILCVCDRSLGVSLKRQIVKAKEGEAIHQSKAKPQAHLEFSHGDCQASSDCPFSLCQGCVNTKQYSCSQPVL